MENGVQIKFVINVLTWKYNYKAIYCMDPHFLCRKKISPNYVISVDLNK